MTDPFFSVIIPAHNAENHIRKGLDSIMCQVCKDYELIVVCDSCEDNTAQIAREYGAITPEVQFHLDGLTRNKGLDIARGKWILFSDDDDWFLHEFAFQQLYDMAGRHDEDAICYSYIVRGEGYHRQKPESMAVPVWSKCWRREFIGDTRFSFRHYWSDCDFHNKVMRKKHRFVYWDMPLYYYNFGRTGSISEKYGNALLPERTYKGTPAYVMLKESQSTRR